MNIRSFVRRFLLPRWCISLFYFLKYRCRISPRAEVEMSPLLRIGPHSEISSFTKIKATVLYVTHDQLEATTLADRTVVMNCGTIQQIGNPEALYRIPRNLFVASFIGSPGMNIFDSFLDKGTLRLANQMIRTGLDFTGPVKIGIRPEAIKTGKGILARVALVENLGARFLFQAKIDDLSVMVLSEQRPSSDSTQLSIDFRDIHAFDPKTGENLRNPGYCDSGTSQS